jgi:putative ABC transport system permease protein
MRRLTWAWRGLARHRARTALALLGTAVAAAMLLDMVMLGGGMTVSFRSLLESQGFALRMAPRGTLPFDSEATVPGAEALRARLLTVPGIEGVGYALGAQLRIAPAGAADTAAALTASGLGITPEAQVDYSVLEGREVAAPDELMLSPLLRDSLGVTVGDTVQVAVGYDPQLRTYTGRRALVVTAIVRFTYLPADQPAAALLLPTLQAMGGEATRDRFSLGLLRVAPGADVAALAAQLNAAEPSVTVLSTADAVRSVEQRLSYFRQLALILGTVSLVVGFLLVSTLVTVSVQERVGEMAVMRALGVSRPHIAQQVMLEGLAISVAGALAGLVLGLATAEYLNTILRSFPGLPAAIDFFVFEPRAAYQSFAMLIVTAVLAGAFPAWRAASLPSPPHCGPRRSRDDPGPAASAATAAARRRRVARVCPGR